MDLKKKKKNNINYLNMARFVSVVVCLVVIIAGGIMISRRNEISNNNQELVAIANPITKVQSIEELKKYFNVKIPVLDKEVEEYCIIGYEGYANHCRIVYKDNTVFNLNLINEDASGIHGGTDIKEEKIKGVNVKFYRYDGINFATWTKDDINYSYANYEGEINKIELEKLVK